MPQYRFLTHDGLCFADLGTSEHLDVEDARSSALRLTAGLLAEQSDTLDRGTPWIMAVTDPAGQLLFRVVVAVLDEPRADAHALVWPHAQAR